MRKQAELDAIAALVAAGFVEAGTTAVQHVRIPTTKNPVFGGIGGELTKLGGRPHFVKPGTDVRATVGPRTTNIYAVVGHEVKMFGMHDTKDIAAIRATLATL